MKKVLNITLIFIISLCLFPTLLFVQEIPPAESTETTTASVEASVNLAGTDAAAPTETISTDSKVEPEATIKIIKKKIAILDFTNAGSDAKVKYLSTTIPKFLEVYLSETNNFELVDLNEIRTYIKKADLTPDMLALKKTKRSIASNFKANIVIFGTYSVQEDGNVTIVAQSIEVGTESDNMISVQKFGDVNDPYGLIDQVIAEMRPQLQDKYPKLVEKEIKEVVKPKVIDKPKEVVVVKVETKGVEEEVKVEIPTALTNVETQEAFKDDEYFKYVKEMMIDKPDVIALTAIAESKKEENVYKKTEKMKVERVRLPRLDIRDDRFFIYLGTRLLLEKQMEINTEGVLLKDGESFTNSSRFPQLWGFGISGDMRVWRTKSKRWTAYASADLYNDISGGKIEVFEEGNTDVSVANIEYVTSWEVLGGGAFSFTTTTPFTIFETGFRLLFGMNQAVLGFSKNTGNDEAVSVPDRQVKIGWNGKVAWFGQMMLIRQPKFAIPLRIEVLYQMGENAQLTQNSMGFMIKTGVAF